MLDGHPFVDNEPARLRQPEDLGFSANALISGMIRRNVILGRPLNFGIISLYRYVI